MAPRHHPEAVPESHAATRQALLTAAADVFAEAGFRNATIRDICRRAKANVAAVNYHFGDKAALYSEVLAEQSRVARERFPAAVATAELSPDEQLQAFIRSFLQRVLSPELHARHGRIMAREMVDPTGALDRLVREAIRPDSERLLEIMRTLLGPETSPATLRLCGMSVVGQILFYCHCQPVIQRLFPDAPADASRLDELAEHIGRFSLAALHHYRTDATAKARTNRPARRRST
jgi:TetR/AcrR family transcriptional regulator, regulator of cefoperazone and chloramphenicol sensitivity